MKPTQVHESSDTDLESGESFRISSKVTPGPDFYNHHHYQLDRHPQPEQMMHYQHYQHHHYTAPTNKNIAMNPAGKQIISPNNHNNNHNIKAQLTAMRGNGVSGIGVGYENRDPYELMIKSQSYEEQLQSLASRSPSYQSNNPIVMQLHHLPHHTHVGMRFQGLSHIEPHGTLALIRSHHRASSGQGQTYYREIQAKRGSGSSRGPIHVGSGPYGHSISAIYPNHGGGIGNEQTPIFDQEIHQSAPVSVNKLVSSNQPSNLVPDGRQIMNYGQLKYAYPGSAQYIYSWPNSHKKAQLMILRRPIIQKHPQPQSQPAVSMTHRRPNLGTMMMQTGSHDMALSQTRPVFMERKKSIYHGAPHKINGSGKQNVGKLDQITKLMKLENKRVQTKEKISTEDDVVSADRSSGHISVIEPAKNTGFDPDSIIIESGFKPIISDVMERYASAGRSQEIKQNQDFEDYQLDEAISVETNESDSRTDEESFEPIFVPSPPIRNRVKKRDKKMIETEAVRTEVRPDDSDDMEMAADRLYSYYLPPSRSIVGSERIDDRISSGTFIAFDGNRVKDLNLARSVSPVEEDQRSRSRLSSDDISRTPQFGKFRGELPPSISGDVRPENITQFELHGRPSKHRVLPPSRRSVTELTPLERTKRSAQRIIGINFTGCDYHSDHHHEKLTFSNAGRMLITNIQYVVLTVVLYFAI